MQECEFPQCFLRLVQQQAALGALCQDLSDASERDKVWNRHLKRLLIIAIHAGGGTLESVAEQVKGPFKLIAPFEI